MIAQVIRTCRERGRKIGICGQTASGYPDFAQYHRASREHHGDVPLADVNESAEEERFNHHGEGRVTLGLLGPDPQARGCEKDAEPRQRDGKDGGAESLGDQRRGASEHRPNRERAHTGKLGLLRVFLLPSPLPDQPDQRTERTDRTEKEKGVFVQVRGMLSSDRAALRGLVR